MGVQELYRVQQEEESITLGANVSLRRAIELFRYAAKSISGFHHLQDVADHWTVVASETIRNVSHPW